MTQANHAFRHRPRRQRSECEIAPLSRRRRLGDVPEGPIAITPGAMPSLPSPRRSVRLQLGGLARGEGLSLQDAADDLIRHLLSLVLAFRSSGFRASSRSGPISRL